MDFGGPKKKRDHMTQETKVSKKKAFTLRLDRETVDEIDALGETRTGKAQELINIGLAHHNEYRDLEKKINSLESKISDMTNDFEIIKGQIEKITDIFVEWKKSFTHINQKIDSLQNTITSKIDEESQKKRGFLR